MASPDDGLPEAEGDVEAVECETAAEAEPECVVSEETADAPAAPMDETFEAPAAAPEPAPEATVAVSSASR